METTGLMAKITRDGMQYQMELWKSALISYQNQQVFKSEDYLNARENMNDFIKKLHQTNNKFNNLQKFIFSIIILSIVSVVLETEKNFYSKYSEVFYYINYFFAIFFAIEYFLRVFTCHYRKSFKGIEGKVKYIFSFYSFIDLVAFFPFASIYVSSTSIGTI